MNEQNAIEKIKRLSHCINCADELAELVERLIRERDEARRDVCRLSAGKEGKSSFCSPDAMEYAKSKNWDCFSVAATNPEIAVLQQQIENMRAGLEGCCRTCEPVGVLNQQLTQELNRLRRQYCEAVTKDDLLMTPEEFAEHRGWDCFKGEGT